MAHDDVIKWKHFPRYWPFVRGIHRSPVNSPHKGQWRGALSFSLISTRINGWVNNGEASDLRHHRAHYDVTVMSLSTICQVILSKETQTSSELGSWYTHSLFSWYYTLAIFSNWILIWLKVNYILELINDPHPNPSANCNSECICLSLLFMVKTDICYLWGGIDCVMRCSGVMFCKVWSVDRSMTQAVMVYN